MKYPSDSITGEYLDPASAISWARSNGTDNKPGRPRSLQSQAGSRSFLLTWEMPPNFPDIVGFKIYKDNEGSLLDTINDPNVRQYRIPSSSGSTPTITNAFVTAFNIRGVESNAVQVQGSSATEAGAPPEPAPPVSSSASGTTGIDTGFGGGGAGGNKLPR